MVWLILLDWAAVRATHYPTTGASRSVTVYTASGKSLEVSTGATRRLSATVPNA